MIPPVLLYEYNGLTLTRHQKGFGISLFSDAGVTSMIIPFAEGDKLAAAIQPAYDPERAAVDVHPDD